MDITYYDYHQLIKNTKCITVVEEILLLFICMEYINNNNNSNKSNSTTTATAAVHTNKVTLSSKLLSVLSGVLHMDPEVIKEHVEKKVLAYMLPYHNSSTICNSTPIAMKMCLDMRSAVWGISNWSNRLLGVPDDAFSNRELYKESHGLKSQDPTYTGIADTIRQCYCRRCGIYICNLHGNAHVLPQQRNQAKRPACCPIPDVTLPTDIWTKNKRSITNTNTNTNTCGCKNNPLMTSFCIPSIILPNYGPEEMEINTVITTNDSMGDNVTQIQSTNTNNNTASIHSPNSKRTKNSKSVTNVKLLTIADISMLKKLISVYSTNDP